MKRCVWIFVILFLISNVMALSEEATLVEMEIEQAATYIPEMQSNNLGIIRYNDTLLLTQQFFEAQVTIEENNGTANFELIKEKLKELDLIRVKAYVAGDELKALSGAVESTTASNATPINDLYTKAQDAFKAERYEEAFVHIEATYEKISEMESVDTKFRAWRLATSRSFANTLKTYWIHIVSTIVAIIVLVMIFYAPVSRYVTRKRIKYLEERADSVKGLIADTQLEFFDKQTMNEGTYHTRIKKYGELLRDIHRQIPMLKEKLALTKGIFSFNLKKGD